MYFDCVCNGTHDKLAWGKLSFDQTIKGLKKNGRKGLRHVNVKVFFVVESKMMEEVSNRDF